MLTQTLPAARPASASSVNEDIRALHDNKQASLLVHTGWTLLYVAFMALSMVAWLHWHWSIMLLCWVIGGHIGHSKLISFHEASHGTLCKNRLMNEAQGIFLGCIMMVPLSSYRLLHCLHHAYIGSERDLEMWPFVNTRVGRGWRILAAVGELCFGLLYTPIVFLHGVLAAKSIPRNQLRRIKWEYALCVAFWGVILTTIHLMGWWTMFLVGYVGPAAVAGNLQSLRKFTEHVGLFGNTILTVTRTVVDKSSVGSLLSESMLHIDYHGVHHRYAKIPYYNLPTATDYCFAEDVPKLPVFPSYLAAMWDMVKSLGNPRIGAQWLKTNIQPSPTSAEPRAETSSPSCAIAPILSGPHAASTCGVEAAQS